MFSPKDIKFKAIKEELEVACAEYSNTFLGSCLDFLNEKGYLSSKQIETCYKVISDLEDREFGEMVYIDESGWF